MLDYGWSTLKKHIWWHDTTVQYRTLQWIVFIQLTSRCTYKQITCFLIKLVRKLGHINFKTLHPGEPTSTLRHTFRIRPNTVNIQPTIPKYGETLTTCLTKTKQTITKTKQTTIASRRSSIALRYMAAHLYLSRLTLRNLNLKSLVQEWMRREGWNFSHGRWSGQVMLHDFAPRKV